MNNFINLLIIAITPGIALFILTFYLIKYDKESFFLLLKILVYGFLIAIPVIFFEKILMSFDVFPQYISQLYKALIVAGFTEEFFKRFVIVSLAYKSKHFNKKFDGIIFAVVVALGFATSENIMYIAFDFQSYSVGFPRAVISTPGHILFAITMGYYLSMAKFSLHKNKKQHYFVLSLAAPIIMHGIFDFLIYVQVFVFIPIFLIFLILLFIRNIKKLNEFYNSKEKEINWHFYWKFT